MAAQKRRSKKQEPVSLDEPPPLPPFKEVKLADKTVLVDSYSLHPDAPREETGISVEEMLRYLPGVLSQQPLDEVYRAKQQFQVRSAWLRKRATIPWLPPAGWSADDFKRLYRGAIKICNGIIEQRQEPAAATEQATARPEPPAPTPSEARARTVATIIGELDILKPQMYGADDYERLEKENPDFLTFEVAKKRRDLKLKVLNVQGHRRHFRLAQELAAAYHGRQLSTIQTDWKRHKPQRFRQKPR